MQTEDRKKRISKLTAVGNSRLQGTDGWEKLPFFWFLLFLSYKCTKRCSYCYAFNQVGDDNCLEMDEKTFSRLLEWIPEVWKANNIKVNIVNFLGGEPLLRTDRIRSVMDSVFNHTDGMQGLVNTNGDLVDAVNWDDLEYIKWMTINITDTSIDELSRRMKIIADRSNVVNQPDIPDECRTCESKTTCQGGCPRDKLLMTGSRSGKSVVCDIHREIIPRLRQLEQLKKHP